jgi:hypothetical protein
MSDEIQRAWRNAPTEIKGQSPSQFRAFACGYRAALAQSDAEPVAWLLSSGDGKRLGAITDATTFEVDVYRERGITVEPLYRAPPRPVPKGTQSD